MALVTASACESQPNAETTARLFLDHYLIAADQHTAKGLTTGRARAEIQKEIDLLAGLQGRDQMVRELTPEVDFEKIYRRVLSNGDIAFLFRVDIRREGTEVPSRDVFLMLESDGEGFKVKSFRFRSPSDNRTSGTP